MTCDCKWSLLRILMSDVSLRTQVELCTCEWILRDRWQVLIPSYTQQYDYHVHVTRNWFNCFLLAQLWDCSMYKSNHIYKYQCNSWSKCWSSPAWTTATRSWLDNQPPWLNRLNWLLTSFSNYLNSPMWPPSSVTFTGFLVQPAFDSRW